MDIRFFEKPGCINNTKQKALLIAVGHNLTVFSLLTYQWEKAELRRFFGTMPVIEWFNPTAPVIKRGEVVPEKMNEEQALEAMLHDPLLIRRPLIEAGGLKACGFDNPLVHELINHQDVSHLQSCPNAAKKQNCE